MNRRSFLKSSAAASVCMVNRGAFQLFAGSPRKYSTRAIDLVQRSTVIDMQCPLGEGWTRIMAPGEKPEDNEWFYDPTLFKAEDFDVYKRSGLTVIQTGTNFPLPNPYEVALKFYASWNGFLAHHCDWLMRIDSPERLDAVKRSGKLGVILGFQDSDHFRTVDDIDYFYSLGQRVSQLTYNTRNLIGSGSTERNDDGLSDFGISVVQRMNSLGMAVDISHCGDRTSLDACEFSKSPVLVTHSNCRALNPNHPRCKPDELIKKLASTGGVMGITSFRPFVKSSEPTTIEDVLDHFDHVARLAGVEHAGIGNDSMLQPDDNLSPEERKKQESHFKSSYGFRDKFYIEGLNHPQRMFDLTEGLIRRKYSDSDIQKILGENFKRALTLIWTAKPLAANPREQLAARS